MLFGVEAVLCITAAKKRAKWYRGVLAAAEWLMDRWHRMEAERSRLRHDHASGKSMVGVDGEGEGVTNILDTAVGESKGEMAGRVAWFQFD